MRGRIVKLALAAVAVLLVVAETPRVAQAIPAWSRKLGASCNLCHYPNVPRLNTFGQRYRNAGYRTEDEMNKYQDITKVGDFLALRARVRYTYKNRQGQSDQNGFSLNDVTFFYAGALAKNFSAFTETEIEGEGGEVVPLGQIFGYYGDWNNFGSFRVGQMHTLTRVGWGGFDRPTGISTPLVLSTTFTKPFGGAPFKLTVDERALELAYVFGNSKILGQALNGVNADGSGTSSPALGNNQKDFLLAYQYLLGDIASGLTAFGYQGQVLDVPEGVAGDARVKFYRFGVSLDYVFDSGFEIQSGYVRGIDYKPQEVGGNFQSQGGWVDFEQYFQDQGITPFTRFDWINPKLGGSNGDDVWQLQGTLGFAMPVQDFLRLASEGQVINDRAKGTTNYQVVVELMANF